MIEEEYEDYIFLKMFHLVMLESDIDKVQRQIPNMFTIEFLHDFLFVINFYCEFGYIGGDLKSNVLNYVNKFRFMEIPKETEENFNKKIALINELIVNVNKQKSDNSLKFYRDEMYVKTHDINFLYGDNEYIHLCKDLLKEFIKYDCAFLYMHSHLVSEEEFNTKCYPVLLNDDTYYQTINSVLNDAPELFLNPEFRRRVILILKDNYILADNKHMKKNIKKLEKIIKKTQ